MQIPFLFPLVALIIGIIIGDAFILPGWGIIPVLLATVFYLYILKKSSTPLLALKYNKSHLVWISLLFAGIGIFDISLRKPSISDSSQLEGWIVAEGEIIEANSLASGDRFIVEVSRLADSSGRLKNIYNFQILLISEGISADPGDIVVFPARFKPVMDNPNLRPSGYAERMRRIGISYQVNAKEDEIRIKGFNNAFSNSAETWRNRIVAKIEKSSLSRPACNFIVALLFGDRSFLSQEVKETFSNAGVAHVLALSGMHIAIIMGMLLIILFPLKLIGLHRLRYIIALIVIWGYAFFTGFAPSTVRACVMTSFVIGGLCMQRRSNPENALLFSAFIILLVNPYALFDIGMQLSFLCVGSILLFAGPLNPVNRHHHPTLHSVIAAVLVSLVSTVTTWVVVSFYFSRIPLLFLPVNLCILPLLPAYMGLGVVYVILILIGIDLTPLVWLLSKGYSLFEWITLHLSSFGEAAVSVNVQLPVVILWLLGILIIIYALKKRTDKSRVLLIGGATMLFGAIICVPLLKAKEQNSIIFQKNYNDIALALYEGDTPLLSTLPRNSVSRLVHKGSEVLSIDCAANIDSLANIIAASRRSKKRYLILGSGFKNPSLKDIPGLKDYDKIILHSSIKRKMENKLKEEALEIGLNTLYSLREEGPLEELLPDSLPANK